MDDTRAALFGTFREEVDTHLLRLSQGLVSLEQAPQDAELLRGIFRSAHTIKGAAKMMGFVDIAHVTHEMESVLGVMRDGQLQLTADISDLLLAGVEVITALTRLLAQPDDPGAQQILAEMNPEALGRQLRAIGDGVAPASTPAAEGAHPTAALPAPPGRPSGGSVLGAIPRPDGGSPRASGALQTAEDTVRVRVQKLDTLLNLSGEMVISKMQHGAILGRLGRLMECERNRARCAADLSERIQQSWGAMNQMDMAAALSGLRVLDSEIDDLTARALHALQEYAGRLNSVADDLADTVLSVRLLPIDTIFTHFPLAVRNFKRETAKDVDLQVRGGETELDKQILEAVSDPLIHLLRNALDHGIESAEQRQAAGKAPRGRIIVQAASQGTQVSIAISDDGAGMDPAQLRRVAVEKKFLSPAEAAELGDEEALALIYQPGFSTAGIITDGSGRGVGMDVVKTTVDRLNGSVSVQSRRGEGTTVTLRLPLTLATMQALLVRVGSQIFVLPSHMIEGGMEYVSRDEIRLVESQEMVQLKGRSMPLVRLAALLDLDRVESGAWLQEAGFSAYLDAPAADAGAGSGDAGEPEDGEHLFPAPLLGNGIRLHNKQPGVIVGNGDRLTCFLVDELIDELDVVVKPLGPLVSKAPAVIGATILGDGRVVLILDVPRLLAEARQRGSRGQLAPAWRRTGPARKPRILVVDDSITTRELERSILENAGYSVEIAVDGVEALTRLEQQGAAGEGRFDLMVADIEMPRMDGLTLTQNVKTHAEDALRALPVIIVSSLASEAYKQRGVEVGAQAYMTKGQFDQGHLLETIDLLIH